MTSWPHGHRARSPGRTLVQLPLGTRLVIVAVPLALLWLAVAWALG